MSENETPTSRPNNIEAFVERDDRQEVQTIFKNLKAELPALTELLEQYSGHRHYEDPIYRFYHQSFKMYRLQGARISWERSEG